MTAIGLPMSHDGHPIRWGAWSTPGIALCGRSTAVRDCGECGTPGIVFASGSISGTDRATAHHCPACGWLAVYWRSFPPGKYIGKLELIEERKGRALA